MAPIVTFVFFDIETTGLPMEDNNSTRITELSMVAVTRDHILEQGALLKSDVKSPTVQTSPRVINKLTLCLNPRKMISAVSSDITGLTNQLLEHQVHFNEQVFSMMDNFLGALKKPVCLVSHNGHRFDFPILKNHLEKLNVNFSADLLCADSIYVLYDILEGDEERVKQVTAETNEMNAPDHYALLTSMQAQNETTPKKCKLGASYNQCTTKRRIFYENNPKPKLSYRLVNMYERIVGCTPLNAHRAEDDCILLLQIAVKLGDKFIKRLDSDNCLFQNVKAMTPGVPMGL